MMMRLDRILLITLVTVFAALSLWSIATGHLLMGTPQGVGTLLAAGLTLAIYSFLYDDNPLFKIAEHLYVGLSVAYTLVQTWFTLFVNDVIAPLLNWSETPGSDIFIILVSTLLGTMILMQISHRFSWVSRIPFAFIVGFYSGFSIPTVISAFLLEQLRPSLNPLAPQELWAVLLFALIIGAMVLVYKRDGLGDRIRLLAQTGLGLVMGIIVLWLALEGLSTLLVLIGVVSVLVYFYFSVEHTGTVGVISKVGIWFLMVAFGASFGFTIMGRISIFIGRINFLLGDWLPVIN